MTEKTTIQIKASTRDKLTELQRAPGETYDSVVNRLIEDTSESELPEDRIREIAQAEINDLVRMEALE